MIIILNIKYYNTLIKIDREDIYKINLENIIVEKFNIKKSRCPLCGYSDDHIINLDTLNDCLTTTYSNINLPHFLSFVFDLEDENTESFNLNNLHFYQKFILNLIKSETVILNIKYKLIALIHYPIESHYTATAYEIRKL